MIVDNITINDIRMKVIYDNIDHTTVFNGIVPESNKLVMCFYKNISTHELFLIGKYSGTGTATFTINNLPNGFSLPKTDGGFSINGNSVTFTKTSGSNGFIIGNMSQNGSVDFIMTNSTVSDVYILDIYSQPHYNMNDNYYQMSYYNNTNNLILLPEPSIYEQPINVTGVLNAGVGSFVYTNDGTPPTVAKYIAYDTLNPPNPFIAVVQDNVGGNVAFDGGFPKFYNNTTGNWTTFSQLNPQCKYLHNALKWIANDKKVELGNNKLLVVSDANTGASYSLDYAASGFKKTTEVVCAVAGLEPTIMGLEAFGGMMDFDSAFLEQFCGILFWGTSYRSTPAITQEAVEALLNFRVLGNGMMFITDHGNASTGDYTDGGFYRSANEILHHYNAYFYGNVNRSSVNVGFLRNNYGDHPLYDGLTDAEYIPAGGSESNVIVQSLPEYTSVPDMNFSVDGFTTIKALVILDDGNVVYETYSYGLNVAEPFEFIDPDTGSSHSSEPTLLNYAKVDVIPNLTAYPELKGNLKIGSNIIGHVDYSYDKSYDGIAFYKFNNNALVPSLSSMGLEITYPVSYTKNIPINRQRVNTKLESSLGRFNEKINLLELSQFSSFERLPRLENTLGELDSLSYARKKRTFDRYMNDELIYGYPSSVDCVEGNSVSVSITSLLSNNTGDGLSFTRILNTHGCTTTVSGDTMTITPTTLAYSDCGVEIEFVDNRGIAQKDSVFVKVTDQGQVQGFIFNTYNQASDYITRLSHIIENYNLALLRTPSIGEVKGWYDAYNNNGWTRQQLDDSMQSAAISNGESWNYDRQIGIDTYGSQGNPNIIVVDDDKYYYPYYEFGQTTIQSNPIVVDRSYEYINPLTNHRFYLGNKNIKYNVVTEVDYLDIKQRESITIPKTQLMSNDSDGERFNSLGASIGCTVSESGSNLIVSPTARKGELSYFEYNVENYFGDIAAGTTSINITELDQINAILYADTFKVDWYKSSVVPPDGATILNTWLRTSGNEYFPDPTTATGDASAWYIDGSGNFVQPNNSGKLQQIWSPTKEENYTFEATLRSSNADNDSIGLVAAADYDGQVISVMVNIHTGGIGGLSRYSLVYFDNPTDSTGWPLANGIEIVGNNNLASRAGWSNAYIRIRIERTGNIIKVYRSNWNSTVIDTNTELSVDLSTILGGRLTGARRYGYSTLSQGDSKYLNINFTTSESYDITKVGDMVTDTEYEYQNGSWVTLPNSVRTTYDYPRKIRNPVSNDLFYLDFPNTVNTLYTHNPHTFPNTTVNGGDVITINPDVDWMPYFAQPSTFVKFVSQSSNVNIIDNNNGTYDIHFLNAGIPEAHIGMEIDDNQGYKTFEKFSFTITQV